MWVVWSLCYPVAAADWPQWRGAGRDGHVATLPKTLSEMKPLWKQPVAGTCDAGIGVAGGILVMADHDDTQDYYRCYAAADGKALWKRSFPNDREMDHGSGPRATPLFHKNKVYVLSAFGELYCFDLKTGNTVWQEILTKEFGVKRVPNWGYCGSLLVADGKLIVNPGGKAAVVAMRPETGEVVWQGEGGQPNYSSFIAGRFGGVEQVVGYDATSLGGWELPTGKRLWTLDVETGHGYIVPTPLAVGDKLLIADGNNQAQLFAFDQDGKIRETPVARNKDLAPEISTPVSAGDMILGQAENLVCVDAAGGLKTLWVQETENAFRNDCHLILAEDRALAMNSKGVLVLFQFDRQGMKVLGKKTICKKTLMHPTVVDGRLYVRDSNSLYCYEL
jgi:outer membrane protein assembly factor BamB